MRRGSRATAVGALTAALVAVVAVRRVGRVEVTGESMAPTLRPGDRLLVWRGRRAPIGSLVVVGDPRAPGRRVVKRLVAAGPSGAVVRGDNPAASTDSRTWGPVPWRLVHGRVVRRYGPPARAGRIPRGRSDGGHRNGRHSDDGRPPGVRGRPSADA